MMMKHKEKELDLNTPQRMSLVGLALLYFRLLFKAVKGLGFLIVYFIYKYYFQTDEASPWITYLPVAIGILFLLLTLGAWIQYWNYKFYIEKAEDVFVLERGFFSKEKTIVQLEKIFQVTTKQNVWHQVLDVYELEIETAGSVAPEVRIQALSEQHAQALKEALYAKRVVPSPTLSVEEVGHSESAKMHPPNITYIGNRNILIASLLSHYGEGLRVSFGAMLLLFSQFREWFALFFSKSDVELLHDAWDYFEIAELVFLLGLFLLLPFLVNMYRFVVKYYNEHYTIKENDELHLTYGLFTLQERIFKSNKLQQIKIVQNRLLQYLGLRFVTLSQAEGHQGSKSNASIVLPGISVANLNQLEHLFYGKEVQLGNAYQPVLRKLLLHIALIVLIGALLGVVLYIKLQPNAIAYGVLGVLFAFLLVAAFLHYKNDKLYVHPHFIVKQSGSFRKSYTIIQPFKIQNIVLRRKVWNPKYGSLFFYTASGVISAKWYEYNTMLLLSEGIHDINIRNPQPWM